MAYAAKAGRLSAAVKAALEGKEAPRAASNEAVLSDDALLHWSEEDSSGSPESYDDWEERRQNKMHAALRKLGRETFVLLSETVAPYRAFTSSELAILRGAENDPRIVEAFNIFQGAIVAP